MSVDDREIWQGYESDGSEALREIEEGLLALEGDPTSVPNIHRLYRGLHSLKGNSGFLGLSTIEHLAHVSEDLIGLVRDGGVALDQEIVDLMLEAVDALRGMVETASRDRHDGELSKVEGLIERIVDAYSERGGKTKQTAGVAWGLFDDEPLEDAPPASASRPASTAPVAPAPAVPPPAGPALAASALSQPDGYDASQLEFFLALAAKQLPEVGAALLAAQTGDASGDEARTKLGSLCDTLADSAERLSLVHVVDAVAALRGAARAVVGVTAANALELALYGAVVDVEVHYAAFARDPQDFGLISFYRRACGDMAFGDLARLRDLVDAPKTIHHAEILELFARLRFACEYYGLHSGAEACLDLEDRFARAVEAGAAPPADVLRDACAFIDELGHRIQAVNGGEDVPDMSPPESPTDPMKFAPDLGVQVSPDLLRHMTRTAMGVLSQLRARGWAPVEVRARLEAHPEMSQKFNAWMSKSGAVCVMSAVVDEPGGGAPSYRFLLGVASEDHVRRELAALDPTGAVLALAGDPSPAPQAGAPAAATANAPAGAGGAPAAKANGKPERAAARGAGGEDGGGGDGGPRERSEFLRIDASKVSLVMDLASEIGLAAGAVTRHPDLEGLELEGFAAAAHKLELLVREMQNEVSGMRLVPVAGVFQRMKRVVRDTARRTGKLVELTLEGEETEIDKVMVDSLQDPLVHVLRNAIDHGLETEEDRVRAGKSPTGHIVLSASHQGGEVSIEVSDDGRGLDRERIVARAKERGLVAEGATLTEAQIHQLIFAPGFSTKEAIDELSGRGVGMDVVKTTVEGLRGRVHLRSTPGRGSRITMTMPLTLAFVEAMVVRERERLFALPIEKVFEVFKPTAAQLSRSSANGTTMLRVRDTLVPVLWLHRFWAEDVVVNESLDERIVVVVQTSQGGLALPVDALLGNQQVMLKPLRGALSGIRAAAGCGMLRTGDVAVALDCERLHG